MHKSTCGPADNSAKGLEIFPVIGNFNVNTMFGCGAIAGSIGAIGLATTS